MEKILRWPHHGLLLLAALGLMGGKLAADVHKMCSNPVPGIDRMTHGIDATSFDLYSKHKTGIEHQVVQFTCDKGRTKKIDGKVYDLPDQVGSVTSVHGGIFRSVVDIVRTYAESRKSVAKNFGAEGFLTWFGFSTSVSLSSMQRSIFNKSSYIERVSSFESAHRANMVPDFMLRIHPYAQHYIDEYLPPDFIPESAVSRNPYREFIRYFGTHYFLKANFGGMLLMNLETRSKYYQTHKESTVKAQAEASFLNFFRGGGGYAKSKNNVDESFKSNTTVSTQYLGGKADLLKPITLQEWQPTVSTHPWLFSGKLTPISNLIRDNSKRVAMERAVADYVLRPHLDELSRLISSRQNIWAEGKGKMNQLQSKLAEQKTKALLNVSEVKALSDDVVQQVSIPRWFSEKTQLCFNWTSPYAGHACSAPARKLCALPGQMTSAYSDNTYSSYSCYLSWSLTAILPDAWFNNVQICYRWQPVVVNQRCGGRKNGIGEVCARVNSFTQNYKDIARSGCLVSWRLVVPASAPVWAHNIQLCFVWWPRGNTGECGTQSTNRRLCASAGSWTAYYKDHTDTRSGSCLMTWGIHVPFL